MEQKRGTKNSLVPRCRRRRVVVGTISVRRETSPRRTFCTNVLSLYEKNPFSRCISSLVTVLTYELNQIKYAFIDSEQVQKRQNDKTITIFAAQNSARVRS